MTPLSRRFRRLPIARRRELADLARRAAGLARAAASAPWPPTAAGLARTAAHHARTVLEALPADRRPQPA